MNDRSMPAVIAAVVVVVILGGVMLDECDRSQRQGRWQCANYPTDHECVELHGKPRP